MNTRENDYTPRDEIRLWNMRRHGLSYDEIAAILGRSYMSVYFKMRRRVKRLASCERKSKYKI